MKKLFTKYRAYIQNNPEHFWFKRKWYGWGWTPATIEGWAVIILFLVLIIGNALRIDVASHSVSDTLLNFIPQTAVLVLILIVICYKTGEKPKWQWGIPNEEGSKEKK